MLKTDIFFPKEPSAILSDSLSFLPFKSQINSTGKSPIDMLHWTLFDSPICEGSSPKVKGRIFGKTIVQK